MDFIRVRCSNLTQSTVTVCHTIMKYLSQQRKKEIEILTCHGGLSWKRYNSLQLPEKRQTYPIIEDTRHTENPIFSPVREKPGKASSLLTKSLTHVTLAAPQGLQISQSGINFTDWLRSINSHCIICSCHKEKGNKFKPGALPIKVNGSFWCWPWWRSVWKKNNTAWQHSSRLQKS